MAIKVREGIFFNEFMLAVVLDPEDIPAAENLCSMLCHAYTRYVGVAGTLAGGGGCVATEKKEPYWTWRNAIEQVKRQGVHEKQQP
jgi:hypothetical protein